MTTNISKTLTSTSRKQIRKEVVNWFLDEEPGAGTGSQSTKYIYLVEKYNGSSIELHRPARLNKGIDFTVNVSNLEFERNKRKYHYPKHSDISNILTDFKNQNPIVYQNKIVPLLDDVYNCRKISLTSTSIGSFINCQNKNRPIEIIILCLKWLFIEQDLTYWNNSGRGMLYNSLKEKGLM